MSLKINILADKKNQCGFKKEEIAQFLFLTLEEYRDDLDAIKTCLDDNENSAKGGFIVLAQEYNEIAGVAVVNKTQMSKYVPPYLLVYIAVDRKHRGKGVGKRIMQKVIENTNDGIALHVEPNNPAKKLYEKLGFKTKYIEMRYDY